MARLPYLDRDDLPEEQRAIFDDLERARGYVPNLYRALANAPRLMADFVAMGADIRRPSALRQDLKELAILTVGRVTGATTIWVSHQAWAREAGLSDEELLGVPAWRGHPAFSSEQRAVMAYAEEVTTEVRASDETWGAVRAFLDGSALAELALVVGFYNMVARFLEPAQVDLDPRYTQRPDTR